MPLPRDAMIELFEAGVRAVDPARAVEQSLRAAPVTAERALYVISFGKAACAMARAALSSVGNVADALVVTNRENAVQVDGARVMAAGHPVPDAAGLRASAAVTRILGRAGAGDRVLVLVSGGGSALLPAPVPGLSLAEKAAVTEMLLGAGLEIGRVNAVRQHLSRLKGGGMLRAAAPARVTALILSDVIGDDLRAIASGPTVAPLMTRADVRALLIATGLWARLPKAARARLSDDDTAGALPEAENRLIGSNRIALEAMVHARPEAEIVEDALTGDVAEAAARIARVARAGGPQLGLFGGETTVNLRGRGRGGRNQELALRVAMAFEEAAPGVAWRFLSAGTDGRDGPTDAAGAVIDGGTLARLRAMGGDADALLAENDSHMALTLSGDLLITGGTGTNVADLQILSLGGAD